MKVFINVLSFILLLQQGVGDKFRFSTFCFQYVVYVVQFVLSLILEPKSKGSYEVLTEVREREREREYNNVQRVSKG